MRLVGLLCHFDERASWLRDCITSYAHAGVTHLVAVDGPYALFPTDRVRSHPDARDAILDTCITHGLPVLYHEQNTKWQGGEVEKRTTMFRLAEKLTQPGVDWLTVMDADERVTHADAWIDALASTTFDTADVLMREYHRRDHPSERQLDRHQTNRRETLSVLRKMYRATPGLYCDRHHSNYRTPDGRHLWTTHTPHMEPGHDLTARFHIDHLTEYRSRERHEAAHQYYRDRDQAGIET